MRQITVTAAHHNTQNLLDIVRLFDNDPSIQVSGTAIGFPDTIALAQTQPADVIILPLHLEPETKSGLVAAFEIQRVSPHCLLLIAPQIDNNVLQDAITAGIADVIREQDQELIPAIKHLASRTQMWDLRLGAYERAKYEAQLAVLTPAERNIYDGSLEGESREELTQKFVKSPHTIKSQVRSMLQKLQADSYFEAVVKTMSLGLLANEEYWSIYKDYLPDITVQQFAFRYLYRHTAPPGDGSAESMPDSPG